MKNAKEGTDGSVYNAGRWMGQADACADICAELRDILDPDDKHHWNLDGVLKEVERLARVNKAMIIECKKQLQYHEQDPSWYSATIVYILKQVLAAGEVAKE